MTYLLLASLKILHVFKDLKSKADPRNTNPDTA